MTRVSLIGAAALLLASCTGAAPPSAAAAPKPRSPAPVAPQLASPAKPAARPATESLLDFAKRIRVECELKGANLECMGGKPENGDIYDVELRPDCGADGFFGGVAEKSGAELRDGLPPTDETTVAVLPKGQFVCIQAIARAGQQPDYFYVTTIQTSAVPECKGNHLCDLYGDRTVDMRMPPVPCPVTGDTSCVAGWIDADAVESFDNGM